MQIEELQKQAQLAYDHELAKQNIQQQMQSRLTVHHNSGVFLVNSELICFLTSWDDEHLVIVDSYQIPIQINRLELLSQAKQRYREVMNEWQLAWENQRKIRSAKNV
jgi:hypothetical protein